MPVATFLGAPIFLRGTSCYPCLLKGPFQLRANDPQGGTSLSRSSGRNHHWHLQAPLRKVETSLWVVEGTDCGIEATECLDGGKEREDLSKSQRDCS